jgi:hypothetical protein
MTTLPYAGQPRPVDVYNQSMPKTGGSTAIPIVLDFTTASSFVIDWTGQNWQGFVTTIQTVYVDNTQNTGPLTISGNPLNQGISVPGGAQAFLPLTVVNPPKFTVSVANGNGVARLIFMNVPMPACVWYPTGRVVSTVDAGITQALTGVPLAVTGPILSLVSHSTTTANPAASTLLMPTATYRKYLLIKAPEAADLWVNIIGGTAAVNGADCIKIPAGSFYESFTVAWQGALTYYCASAGLALTAFEG